MSRPITEEDRLADYRYLVEHGLSDGEARATAWPDEEAVAEPTFKLWQKVAILVCLLLIGYYIGGFL